MKQLGFLSVICLVAMVVVATATMRHVPGEYPTIQAGIDAAADGDTVLVADGTYSGDGNRDIDFRGKAIMVTSNNGSEATIIDCQGSESDPHRGFCFQQGEGPHSVLKEFTIKNGYDREYGGGIHCFLSSPTIEGNKITGNEAFRGGGISCQESSPTIVGNTITRNVAEAYAGGIICYESSPAIVDNIITENTAFRGGGITCLLSSPTIEGNMILENVAIRSGGGIRCGGACPTIKSNAIAGNRAYRGGGISCYESAPRIVGNAVIVNIADGDYGGGIHCKDYSSPVIVCNTISGNSAIEAGGGIACYGPNASPTVLSSVLWANSAGSGSEIYVRETSTIEVTYSDIEGGWEGEGNIDADPSFVLSEHHDYRLLWGSPCIDSGHPDSLDPDGTRSDMGAYPFNQSHPLTIYLTPDTTVITRPGELGVTYTLINIESDDWRFWLQSDVFLPSGEGYPGNPIVGPLEVTMPGETNFQTRLIHSVPGVAPVGVYTYESRIGLPPDQLIDEDIFEFVVMELNVEGDQKGFDPELDDHRCGVCRSYRWCSEFLHQ